MDQQAATLLATLKRSSAASDSKLTLLNNLKSDIKHHRVPDEAQPIIFECLKVAIAQQASSTLATSAFTTLGHLIKRLKIQDPEGHAIAHHLPKLWAPLQERLGDLREHHRTAASQVLADVWPICGHDVEHIIREDIIAGNVRAKETAMRWLVKMHQEASLPFKSYVSNLVLSLEDSDGHVRDAAKNTVIELFRDAPGGAKADLKKQLKLHGVRIGISSQILSQVEGPPAQEVDMAASTMSLDPQLAESINSEAARPPPQEEVPMDPIYVHSNRELEDTFRDMMPCFEGRESEDNWVQRDRNITKLRRLVKGNAPSDYHNTFMVGLKQLQEGILKVANSLRTTMSTNGCQMVQELARTLGPALDPMAEIYLQSFVKMSAATKNIAAQNGNHTVDTIFQYVSYNVRLMQHIWLACQDKNVQPRSFAAGWMRTVLSRQAASRTHFENSGGLDLAEKTIKHGLNDAQPKVKESMRATYWTFAKSWPDRAELIMNTLDGKAKSALERDPNNPNAASASSSLRPASRATAGGAASRASVREAMLAAKRNLARAQKERPNSAMATTSPAAPRSRSTANVSGRQPSAGVPSARVPSTTSTTSRAPETDAASVKPGSLMSGAARRPVKRPEIARPATADPYASRRLLRPETPSSNRSPVNSPRQDTAASLAKSTAVSNLAKSRLERNSPAPSPGRSPKHMSSIPGPSPRAQATSVASPLGQVASPRPLPRSRPSSKDKNSIPEEPSFTNLDDFTIVMPENTTNGVVLASPSGSRRPTMDKSVSLDSGVPTAPDEDNFTLVMPSVFSKSERARSPLATRHTPARAMSEETTTKAPSPASARSPMSQRVRRPSERDDSPKADSLQPALERNGSPLKASTTPQPEEGFHIHEDPSEPAAVAPQQSSHTPQETRVLNELPINESNQVSSPPQDAPTSPPPEGANQNGVASPPASPQSKAEVTRSRKLLMSGIERIRGRTLDAHGFRRVLELLRSSDSGDIFGSAGEARRFDDLCGAVLDYITDPTDATGTNVRHTQELKRQATSLLRTVLNNTTPQYKKWISAGRWHQRAITASFDARRGIDSQGLFVKDLETLASDIVSKIHPDDGEASVLIWLEQAVDADDPGTRFTGPPDPAQIAKMRSRYRALALALHTLASLLASHTPTSAPVRADVSARTARVAAAALRSADAEVRKGAVELATQLHAIWPLGAEGAAGNSGAKSDYWALMERSGVQESARNLIVYFIARRERGVF